MGPSQTLERDNNMICLEVLDELAEIRLEDEEDFKQKIYEIYLTHFLVGDFDDNSEEDGEVVREEEKI